MEVDSSHLILYGGYEGPVEEICEHKRSLGEFLLNRYDQIGSKIVLVSSVLKRKEDGSLVRINNKFKSCRWMESLVKHSLDMS